MPFLLYCGISLLLQMPSVQTSVYSGTLQDKVNGIISWVNIFGFVLQGVSLSSVVDITERNERKLKRELQQDAQLFCGRKKCAVACLRCPIQQPGTWTIATGHLQHGDKAIRCTFQKLSILRFVHAPAKPTHPNRMTSAVVFNIHHTQSTASTTHQKPPLSEAPCAQLAINHLSLLLPAHLWRLGLLVELRHLIGFLPQHPVQIFLFSAQLDGFQIRLLKRRPKPLVVSLKSTRHGIHEVTLVFPDSLQREVNRMGGIIFTLSQMCSLQSDIENNKSRQHTNLLHLHYGSLSCDLFDTNQQLLDQ